MKKPPKKIYVVAADPEGDAPLIGYSSPKKAKHWHGADATTYIRVDMPKRRAKKAKRAR